jgi:diguanylate cyclase (GGDEF)-like protein
VSTTITPFTDDAGEVVGAIDVSRPQRLLEDAAVRLELGRSATAVDAFGRVLHSDYRDLQEVLDHAAEMLAELFADAASVAIISADGQFVDPVAIATPWADQAVSVDAVIRSNRQRIEQQVGQVAMTGKSCFLPDTDSEHLRSLTKPEWGELLDLAGIHSYLCVPMVTTGAPIGSVSLTRVDEASGPYTQADLELVEHLAERLAFAIENTRLAESITVIGRRFRFVFEDSPTAMAIVDLSPGREGLITLSNHALARLLARPNDEINDQLRLQDLAARHQGTQIQNVVEHLVRSHKHGSRVKALLGASGAAIPTRLSFSVLDESGSIGPAAVVHIEDLRVSEADSAATRLHDPLTNFPTEYLLLDRLEYALDQIQRSQLYVAVFNLNLDNFREVNNEFGHAVGDRTIAEVARRLGALLRPSDTIARTGGDEFTVVCPGLDDFEDARTVAGRITRAFSVRFAVAQHDVSLTASCGAAFADTPVPVLDVIRRVRAALQSAQAAGGDRVEFHSKRLDEAAGRRRDVQELLEHALINDELELHYQPIVDLRSELIIGAEALVRINHPDAGLIAPGRFLEVAETTGLITRLGAWVVGEAGDALRRWTAALDRPLRMSVNVSATELDDPNFLAQVEYAVADSPGSFVLELTESVVVEASQSLALSLERVKSVGALISLDDFGTGSSALSSLKNLPIDEIKIDRSFATGVGNNIGDRAVMRAITSLGRSLGVSTVAEGIEDEDQLEFVRSVGADCAQGFYLARPLTEEKLLERLR